MAATTLSPPFAPPAQGDAGDGNTAASSEKRAPSQVRDLPTIYVEPGYWSYNSSQPSQDIRSFLKKDLDIGRLEVVYDLLWWAGRQAPPRPLHRHKLLGRGIAVTEQADLHLVWSEEQVFIKPLSDYLLDHGFWSTHICGDARLYDIARGFLLSYVWLVRHRSDFRVARDAGLLPDDLSWVAWQTFVDAFWKEVDPDHPDPINKRWRYGELRLARLDQIYRAAPRFKLRHLVTGYLYSYASYGGFFKREFAWLIITFAYISIILGAMQVGLGTSQLRDNEDFHRGSYGFAVLAIVFPVAISAIVLVLYVALYLYHFLTTVMHWIRGEKKHQERSRGGQNGGVAS